MKNDKRATNNKPVKSACRGGCCQSRMNRRDFLALTALGTAGAVVGGRDLTVMAGPFEESDYLKLIPIDKKLDPKWVKSLFARGKPKVYRGRALKRIGRIHDCQKYKKSDSRCPSSLLQGGFENHFAFLVGFIKEVFRKLQKGTVFTNRYLVSMISIHIMKNIIDSYF